MMSLFFLVTTALSVVSGQKEYHGDDLRHVLDGHHVHQLKSRHTELAVATHFKTRRAKRQQDTVQLPFGRLSVIQPQPGMPCPIILKPRYLKGSFYFQASGAAVNFGLDGFNSQKPKEYGFDFDGSFSPDSKGGSLFGELGPKIFMPDCHYPNFVTPQPTKRPKPDKVNIRPQKIPKAVKTNVQNSNGQQQPVIIIVNKGSSENDIPQLNNQNVQELLGLPEKEPIRPQTDFNLEPARPASRFTGPDPSCQDRSDGCAQRLEIYSDACSRNFVYMSRRCKSTCHFCNLQSPSVHDLPELGKIRKAQEKKAARRARKNRRRNGKKARRRGGKCRNRIGDDECHTLLVENVDPCTDFPSIMKKRCKKACGFCSAKKKT